MHRNIHKHHHNTQRQAAGKMKLSNIHYMGYSSLIYVLLSAVLPLVIVDSICSQIIPSTECHSRYPKHLLRKQNESSAIMALRPEDG